MITDLALQTFVLDALEAAQQGFDSAEQNAIRPILNAVGAMRSLNSNNGGFLEDDLLGTFGILNQSNAILPLHIKAQNSALIVSNHGDTVHFEAMELSPPNAEVMGNEGRLRRRFPGVAVAISHETFRDPEFQSMLASTLVRLSNQEVEEMTPKVRKAGQNHTETRDTTKPNLVTEFMMTVLAAMGTPVTVSHIWKNTREEVLWNNTFLPWRRSPVWLLLRVTLHLFVSRSAGSSLFKDAMVLIMTHVLTVAARSGISNDLQHCMLSKIARRVRKLDHVRPPAWLFDVESSLSRIAFNLHRSWDGVTNSFDACLTDNLSAMAAFQYDEELQMSLPEVDRLLVSMQEESDQLEQADFKPASWTMVASSDYLPSPRMNGLSGSQAVFDLAICEQWIAAHLDVYMNQHKKDNSVCESLLGLLQMYHASASERYSHNPENISIMALTCLELWIACDKSATETHSLLMEYDPEVPFQLFQSLILPHKHQMVRLFRAEQYLIDRRSRVGSLGSSVFTAFGTANCLPVRYFWQSPHHQGLLESIETAAQKRRDQKLKELADAKATYRRLMQNFDTSNHEYINVYDQRTGNTRNTHIENRCDKCGYRREADSMTISLDEWPLPSNGLAAQSAVFELDVPPAIRIWRDATMFLVMDVCKYQHSGERNTENDYGLRYCLSTYLRTPSARLTLSSSTKPHLVTHRSSIKVAIASASNVCVNNGLQYRYYDDTSKVFLSGFVATDKLADMCTYRLPSASDSMQEFLSRPHHRPNGSTPNTVIASQWTCPDHLTLEEFRALAAIPFGFRIQWRNILLQLRMPSVDFKKVEVGIVFLQTSRQTGPPSSCAVRESHQDLQDDHFALEFLESLEDAVNRIRENWASYRALDSFILLASRLLSLTESRSVQLRCLNCLADCRRIATDWARQTRLKAERSSKDEQRRYLLQTAFDISHVVANTFDIDMDQVTTILANPGQAALFIECAISIQELSFVAAKPGDKAQKIQIQRWQRLMYMTRHILVDEFTKKDNTGLNTAVKQSWPAYPSNTLWQSDSNTSQHWLVTRTRSALSSDIKTVHFNLITAELLVEGLPLSRLPSEYESHPNYKVFFGQSQVDAVPINDKGMRFSAKRLYSGQSVYLGLRSIPGQLIPDLRLRTTKDSHLWDLLPARLFEKRLPAHFVNDYVHWYSHETEQIELRPLKRPWEASADNWKLVQNGACWRMSGGQDSLVSVESTMAFQISHIFHPLEALLHMHILLKPGCNVQIDLPRLDMSFSIQQGSSKIYSRQFRGMHIDPCQSIGTLTGLDSKLVLRSLPGQRRMVLIPNGTPIWRKNMTHVRVNVVHGESNRTHVFQVDARLGRILDNGTLESKLALCRLHALTSYCLPDQLTKLTGTESALDVLRSAAVRSFQSLSEHNIETLFSIANLAPLRSFYPKHEKLMQQVKWDETLSFLAQEDDLHLAVESLLTQARSTKFFYPDDPKIPHSLNHTDPSLVARAMTRNAAFKTTRFDAELHNINADTVYHPRDVVDLDRAAEVYTITSKTLQQAQTLQHNIPNALACHLWDIFSHSAKITGASSAFDKGVLQYDASLLEHPSPIYATHWCSFPRLFRAKAPPVSRFQKAIYLATLAYSKQLDRQSLQILAAVANIEKITRISPPSIAQFDLEKGRVSDKEHLLTLLKPATIPFEVSDESKLPAYSYESYGQLNERRRDLFQDRNSAVTQQFCTSLVSQWPCEVPLQPIGGDFSRYIYVKDAMDKVRPSFKTWHDNRLFYQYLEQLELELHSIPVDPVVLPTSLRQPFARPVFLKTGPTFVTEYELFRRPAPLLLSVSQPPLGDLVEIRPGRDILDRRLPSLIQRLDRTAQNTYDKTYAGELRDSLQSYHDQPESAITYSSESLQDCLKSYLEHCEKDIEEVYGQLHQAVTPKDTSETYLMPRICPVFFLKQLCRPQWAWLSPEWQKAITRYGVALTNLRRVERLIAAQKRPHDLIKELINNGHTNWDPMNHPESLLLEVESGITIREVQERIAQQMRDPQGQNSVMQLNMGEGKSSVIVPIVAMALADSTRLVRVVVAKPQSKQMLQMLTSKVAGLCNRRIFHMPFSRSLKLGLSEAQTIERTYRACVEEGGILLVQPEHILSFQLMGIESTTSGREELTKQLLSMQHFFNRHSRDIVDESDENFSVKFELIYTMGSRTSIDLGSERWTLIQQVLSLIASIAPRIALGYPSSIAVDTIETGHFPRTRILRQDAEQALLQQVADRICSNGLPNLPIARQQSHIRSAIREYITEPHVSQETILTVESSSFWTNTTRGPLLLVRGLIAGGILAFTFGQKRWRVNYGTDSNRVPKTKLALPFRAKDSPTPRSEFSHPDVVIVLTCLSYYYGGLDDTDIELAFVDLMKSDQADIEYHEWVEDAPTLPHAFRQLSGININDRLQCIKEVFPHLRQAKRAVDYFLAHIVFPKYMQEFPDKLSASGWDLGRIKSHPTTGFSGTNDSKHLLPQDVRHLDLDKQRHTNALVLEYLLQPENTVQLLTHINRATVSDASRLLDAVMHMHCAVQVIIDVGAQILELNNIQFVTEWLKRASAETYEAAIFFDDGDETCVVDRHGAIELFQTSPYAQQLDKCVVFLDEAHTRGTDLQLPDNYRAAVTLGPGLTKDRLVQACMRMRKLGKGQSVVFCIPEEIQTKIQQTKGGSVSPIQVSDVLEWAIRETSLDLHRSMPLWACQGTRFDRQQRIWAECTSDAGIDMSQACSKQFLEPESQSLHDRYSPTPKPNPSILPTNNPRLSAIAARCARFTPLRLSSAALHEEQERELAPELEQERHLQRAPPAVALPHSLAADVEAFVRTGALPSGSKAFVPAFCSLAHTSAAAGFDTAQVRAALLVTRDFAATVALEGPTGGRQDLYLRPVQWVLTGPGGEVVVVSPFEAQEMLPVVRAATAGVVLRAYGPRQSLAYEPLEGGLCALPESEWEGDEEKKAWLGLFAGELYFDGFEGYRQVCEMLGLVWRAVGEGEEGVGADGWREGGGGFQESPVGFVRGLLGMRRDGRGIGKTHWGRVLGGEVLREEDFE